MPRSDLLIAARKAIEAIRPQEAMVHLDAFHADFDASRIDPQEATLIEAELRRIRALSEGAMAGFSMARDLLRQLNELSKGCGTYDRDGRRLMHPVNLPEVRKF